MQKINKLKFIIKGSFSLLKDNIKKKNLKYNNWIRINNIKKKQLKHY